MITRSSAEWVLLSQVYHRVLAHSPSPESAKLDISNARQNGQVRLRAELREIRAQPGGVIECPAGIQWIIQERKQREDHSRMIHVSRPTIAPDFGAISLRFHLAFRDVMTLDAQRL
jgi:hypothetical protein